MQISIHKLEKLILCLRYPWGRKIGDSAEGAWAENNALQIFCGRMGACVPVI